jgi:PAS domain S-box-containing protein
VSDRPGTAATAVVFPDERFRRLVEGVVDYAILGLDVDGLVTTWNAGAERIKGYRPGEIIGRHFSVFYPPADLAAGVPAAELAAATANGSFEAEGWRVRKDGSRFWASVVITALFDEDHRLGGFAKVTRDVTERRAAERRLLDSEERARTREAEARLAAIVESSDDAIASLSLDGQVMSWNSGGERLLGFTAEEMIGKNYLQVRAEFLATDRPDELVGILERVARGGPGGQVEVQRPHKDGTVVDFVAAISPVRDSSGALVGMSTVCRDITARKAAEMALRDSEDRSRAVEARLAAMVEFSDDAIWSCSRDGTITTWNGGAEHLYGYGAADMVGCNVLRPGADGHLAGGWIPPGVREELPDIVSRVERGERVGHFETQRIRKDGSVVEVSLTVSPIRDPLGTLTGLSVVARDISERKRHDHTLAEERRRLLAAESIGRVGSWEMDLATNTVVCSDTLLELYGVDSTTFSNDAALALGPVHSDDRDELNAAIDFCRRTGEPFRKRHRQYRVDDGALRWFDVRVERIDADRRHVRLVGVVLDVTEEVLAAKVVEEARDVAVEASRQKSAFLATMSHEIRTPMNAVIGMTGLLLDTALDAEQREFAETVASSGDALLGIINDILDFSKLEAGGLELQSQPFDLRACVEDALGVVAVTANGKGLEVVGQVDERCPRGVVGDVTRLRQVLVNLLGNAVKFTAVGEIALTVEPVRSAENSEVGLRFAVTDTGIGIPADRLAHLFDSFSQVDGSTTRAYGGSGLGLAISHRLVEAMGATLRVDSVSGTGSTFHFKVRLAPAALVPETPAPPPPAMLRGLVALVVDDNATNRRIVRLQLEGWEMHVTEAASADAAMTIIATGEPFDVAVIDMKMPGMSGADLAAILRSSPDTRLLPLVLLSSHMERPSSQHGSLFSAVLTKPVPADQLQTSLCQALKPSGSTPAPLHPQVDRTTGGQALRVLLAEDNPINQLVCRRLLEKLGHLVDVAGNGREALEAVRAVSYDAVLMDIQMPEMDGLEATRLIRVELPAHRQPHIVAVTASVLVEDRQACVDAGMDDYLPKPVRIEDLDIALRKAIAA